MDADRAALAAIEAKTLADVTTAQAETRKAAEAEVAAVRAKAEQAAEEEVTTVRVETKKATKNEFEVGFFQGYSDLKRRVALIHPELDLTAFS